MSRIPTAGSPWFGLDFGNHAYRVVSSGHVGYSYVDTIVDLSYGRSRSPFAFDDYNVMCTRSDGYVLYNNGVGLGSSYGVMKYSYIFPGKG